MSGAVRGWCPGAWRPMASGDGLVVRVRPPLGRLDSAQAAGLAALAERFGSGLLDLTRRANLQIRGVSAADHPALLDGLAGLGLLDPGPEAEARRAISVAPFWTQGDLTDRLARALDAALPGLPDLPAKFGLALDTGPRPLMRDTSADIRVERGAEGPIVCADGAAEGRAVAEGDVAAAVLDLARWFAGSRGARTRMGALVAEVAEAGLPARFGGTARPPPGPRPAPGPCPGGALGGVAFGRLGAPELAALAGAAPGLRLTPWRMVLVEGAGRVPEGLIFDARDPLLSVDACPGAPGCAQATVSTRDVAARLAGRVTGTLHVSGCAKGCARSGPADWTLVGRDGRFDLVRDGRAGDTALRRGLAPDDLHTILR